MADNGSSSVAIVAIIVLVLVVVGLLVYFLGFNHSSSTSIIEKPSIHIEKPSVPLNSSGTND